MPYTHLFSCIFGSITHDYIEPHKLNIEYCETRVFIAHGHYNQTEEHLLLVTSSGGGGGDHSLCIFYK
jgi:hypothetical protein